MPTSYAPRRTAGFSAGLLMALALMNPLDARQAPGRGACRISGHAMSGTTPLPGVAIAVKTANTLRVATSTEIDGGYALNLPPGEYTISADLTGFTRVERPLIVAAEGACTQTIDLTMTLAPRQSAPTTRPSMPATPGAQRGAGANGQRGAAPGTNVVQVQPQPDASAQPQAQVLTEREAEDAARLLLPPGFSTDAPADAITITGNNASLDRGMLSDRFDAIGRGVFDPATGEFGAGFGDQGRGGPAAGRGGPGGLGGPGGRGGPEGFAGRGGPGGPGGFLGGRGVQQQRYSGSTSYTFGGSALDAAPYQLRPQNIPVNAPYTKQNFGGTFGGPLKIKGVYDGTRKTNFTFTYNGADPGDAAWRLLFQCGSDRRSADRTAIPEQPNPHVEDRSVRACADALHPGPESRRKHAQLPQRQYDNVRGGQHQPAGDA